MENKEILLIGDSLTDWYFKDGLWANEMQNWYMNKATVFNRGVAGYTSRLIRELLPFSMFHNKNILFCTILLGTNDCSKKLFVDCNEFKQNLLDIVDHIHRHHPDAVILLGTPPLVNDKKLNIKPYVNKVWEISVERPFITIFDLHSIITPHDLYDYVHFSHHGSNKVFKVLQKIIMEKHPQILPKNL